MPPAITLTEEQNKAMLGLHAAGASSRQIEKILGNIDHTTICRRLKRLTPRKTTEIYKALRADIFAEEQRKLLMACNNRTPKDRLTLITGVGILYDKERLERNQGVSEHQPLVIIVKGENSKIQINACSQPIDSLPPP